MFDQNVTEPPRQHTIGHFLYSRSRIAQYMRLALLTLGVALGLACLRHVAKSLSPDVVQNKDFLQEYTLARAVADGIDPYLPTDVLARRYIGILRNAAAFPHPTPHPPPVGLLLLPLVWFDYSTAAHIWFGLEIACLVVSVHLLGRVLGARLSLIATLAIAALPLTWHPFWVELALGQLMVPMLALLAGAWLALRLGRSALGGALVGLAILLKPVPLPLLLLFLLRKDWRALAAASAVIFGGYLIAGYVMGLDKLAQYATTVLPLVASCYRAYVWNISVASLGWRLFEGTGSTILVGLVAPPVVQSAGAAWLTSTSLPCLVLLAAYAALRKQHNLDVWFCVMVGVSILISPISWRHYLVLALIPAAQVMRWLVSRHLPSRETNLALIVTLLLVMDWERLATLLAAGRPVVKGGLVVPFALALLPMMLAVAAGALTWLVVYFGPVNSRVGAAAEIK